MRLPLFKLVFITTDGAPARIGANLGFICCKNNIYPNGLNLELQSKHKISSLNSI